MSHLLFQKLNVLAECVEKANRLEKEVNVLLARRNERYTNKSVDRYPTDSMIALRGLHSESQELLDDAHKIYHSLKISTKQTEDAVLNSNKILDYMEHAVAKHMPSHVLTSSGKTMTKNESCQLSSQGMVKGRSVASSDSALEHDADSQGDVAVAESDAVEQKTLIESDAQKMTDYTEDLHVFPKSPTPPPCLKHYRSKSDSFCSPLDPLHTNERKLMERNEDGGKLIHPMCNAMNLESPQLRGFTRQNIGSVVDTPPLSGYFFGKAGMGKAMAGDFSAREQTKSFFAPIQSPHVDVGISNSPELTLHCRRSVLSQPPPSFNDEDITVYNLFSHHRPQQQPQLNSPPPPDLTYHKTVLDRDLRMNACTVVPSPELPVDILSSRNVNYQNESRNFEICQDQYDALPSYAKRILALPKCNECLKNVLDASVAWEGCQRKRVITEDQVGEVTALGSKTKSFIFVLKSLGILKEMKGTLFYEILV